MSVLDVRATDGHGRTRQERQAERERRIAEAERRARESAERLWMSQRCHQARYQPEEYQAAYHQQCRGEDGTVNSTGCLCECHDPSGVVILERRDERL